MTSDRRAALLQAKLAALVRGQWGTDALTAAQAAPFPSGAGRRPELAGGPAYVLVEGAHERVLGGVLAWAVRSGAGEVHLLADGAPGAGVAEVLARRAGYFALPVKVWAVEGATLREATGAGLPAVPKNLGEPDELNELAAVLRVAGAAPVMEDGVLRGEVLGLEVARAVPGDGGLRLEVGVGGQDRAFHRELEPDRPASEVLAEVIALVRRYRRAGAPTHLANTLSAERWLRCVLVDRPDVVGATRLEPLPPVVARGDLRTPSAALAGGVDNDGGLVVVAASTGIDLDLVPAAADGLEVFVASGLGGQTRPRLILAIPEHDDHPRTRQLAALLHHPAEVVTVPSGWKALAGSL